MAEGDITIGIPGGGSSDFLTTPIPSLALNLFQGDAGYARTPLGFSDINRFSNYGTPEIFGALRTRWTWQLIPVLTNEQALQMAALIAWQDEIYKSGANGALRMIDEIRYTIPRATPHPTPLLAAINPSWNAGYEYGYGIYNVKLQSTEEFAGNDLNGSPASFIQIGAVEV